MKFSQFSGDGAGDGGGAGDGDWPEKKGEYSVKFNGIFLTAVTASVNGVS